MLSSRERLSGKGEGEQMQRCEGGCEQTDGKREGRNGQAWASADGAARPR